MKSNKNMQDASLDEFTRNQLDSNINLYKEQLQLKIISSPKYKKTLLPRTFENNVDEKRNIDQQSK